MSVITSIVIKVWIVICANYWEIDPAFAMAVAHIESRLPNRQEFRVGKIGKSFYGPFGVHKCYLKQPINGIVYPIDEWPINVWVGCRALRGRNKRAILKRYNESFNPGYWTAVNRAINKYKHWRYTWKRMIN